MISRVIQGKATSMTQPFHLAGQKGYAYYHSGVDLTGFNGQYNVVDWIVAHSDGIVVDIRTNCTGYEDGSYGNYVLLLHSNGYYTMYAHLAYGTVKVAYGQTVKKGDTLGGVLGYMGNTGHSFGAHLHWEVRTSQGICIDPEPYINADLPGMMKPIKVSGKWGKRVTKRAQIIFGVTVNGKVYNQYKKYKSICPSAVNVWLWKKTPNQKGSALIKAIQKWVKVPQDGFIGPVTIKALQKKLKVKETGQLDAATVKKFIKWLNKKI